MTETLQGSTNGLSNDDARVRLAQVGFGLLKTRERAAVFELSLNQFMSQVMPNLLFATGVLALLRERVDAVNVFFYRPVWDSLLFWDPYAWLRSRCWFWSARRCFMSSSPR